MTNEQAAKINRLAKGEVGQKPLPEVPRMSDKLATGSTEEKLAAIRTFNEDFATFAKKSGLAPNT